MESAKRNRVGCINQQQLTQKELSESPNAVNYSKCMKHIIFSHGGKLGDVLYALTFIKELSEAAHADVVSLHLQTDIPLNSVYEPYNKVIMTEEAANCLAPLLRAQPYLSGGISIGPTVPDNAFNLHLRLRLPLNFFAGNIVDWCYPLYAGILPREFHKPVISVDEVDHRADNKIIICRSERYINPLIDYTFLKAYADDIIFLGTEKEHEVFTQAYFDCLHMNTNDYLECARLIAAAKCIIGNQTGLFAIAEQMKVPRILESCQYRMHDGAVVQGCPNVIPTGGICTSVIHQKQFMLVVDNILNMKRCPVLTKD